MPVLDLFLSCLSLNSTKQFELLAIIWWRTWFRRNKLVRKEGPFPAKDPSSVGVLRGHAWRPPEGSLFKINCDATVSISENRIGVGVVIRDRNGDVMLSAAKTMVAGLDPSAVKAKAIVTGMMLAVEAGRIGLAFCH
ncbi:hypothetical protein ACOSP7_013159 [Xanthoceras sorbifolium]